ncbi:hypothetical protein LOAG_04707 [Loa loa]|uniref:Uncharacterized protein n=1 Tax=Loa loa TaxID=7209 RepID=A0A1S0U392_LOALO|nr:hypothetical protein LOAG_04707 [Loa loa]EFO23778.1 hypothetical protein LOAG_04707 [Loa loa]
MEGKKENQIALNNGKEGIRRWTRRTPHPTARSPHPAPYSPHPALHNSHPPPRTTQTLMNYTTNNTHVKTDLNKVRIEHYANKMSRRGMSFDPDKKDFSLTALTGDVIREIRAM